MRYGIYQIQVEKRTSEVTEALMEAMISGTPDKGLALNLYKKVAEIDAADLDECFDIGNIGPEERITRLDRMSSLSVGNIIEVMDTGEKWVVKPIGFARLES